ncbi:MAG: hypothetical protein JOZ32_03350 [Bryobacterales bacterium]|nr:hypothetical protein [Bryobacterales bacterium]
MLLGEFEKAWRESDFISELGRDPERFWTGQSWTGKRVMLRCLHGLGDTIQFIRYAPLLKKTCRSLVVQTHPQLVTLLDSVPGVGRVTTWADGTPGDDSEWDMHMEVNELPRAFRTTLGKIPIMPYLRIPEQRIQWASEWFEEQGHLRIGIAWEAGHWNSSRSIPLEEFAPLFASHECQFFVLQKNAAASDFERWKTVHDLEIHAADIRDTAALILNLDLVITVDTMTAHLAGALARPVWILLPAVADWRWMLNSSATPWYPSARLFRQKRLGDWSGAIKEICAELRNSKVLAKLRSSRAASSNMGK